MPPLWADVETRVRGLQFGYQSTLLVSFSQRFFFDSDGRFGLLDRTVVRRYLKCESVHPVLSCEAPACARIASMPKRKLGDNPRRLNR